MFDETRLYALHDSAIALPGLALRPRIAGSVVTWGDTTRIRRVVGTATEQAMGVVVVVAGDRSLTFAPLDCATFDTLFRPKIAGVPTFHDAEALSAWFLERF